MASTSTRGIIPTAALPGPQKNHAKAMKTDLLGYLEQIAPQGDFLKLPIPLVPTYLINHPDLVQEVMVRQSRRFHKPFNVKYTANQIFGDNLFTSDGELWKILRSVLQPGFSTERLQDYSQTMIDYTEQIMAGWQPGESVDLCAAMGEVTLRTSTRCFFGLDLYSSQAGDNLLRFIELFFQRISGLPVPAWVPIPSNRELKRIIRDLNQFFLPIIEARRQSGEDHGDIMSMLIQAQAADKTGYITGQQVCNEVSNLFAAGYELVAYSLAFTFYLISQHPAVEAKLLAEIDRVLATQPMSTEALAQMPYLEQVLQESMRLLPAAAITSRQAIMPVTIGDYTVPKNSMILIAPWTLHRRADIFPEPEKFDPERFSADRQTSHPIPNFSHLTFAAGPRACIGKAFAMMQMRINLALILQRYRLIPAPDYEFQPVFQFNTRPRDGMPMVLQAR
ncbi:cytochrome P450 [filamentous cyanobacterium LEGE 11480]|uniref:Cytochrome P450 n=1 Tax=Romeriopsis navalis LEGE 11480 TaxID=2777977 RepID=A0A928VKQ3_9CYAN|nr:cytochrome P450 [Romeriopsis navalis]MBE9030120.1 cytochrome P450 [Romeriopsis navalis LEGE 11480]